MNSQSNEQPGTQQSQPMNTPANYAAPPMASPAYAVAGPSQTEKNIKIATGSYSTLALLGMLLFFLPWVNISCRDVTLASQSGLQLVQGTMTKNKNAAKELQESMPTGDDFGDMNGDVMMGDNPLQNPQMNNMDVPLDGMKENFDPFFPAIGYPAGLFIVVVVGGLSFFQIKTNPLYALIGAIVALVMIVGTLVLELPVAKEMTGGMPEEMKSGMSSFISIKFTAMFYLAFVFAILVLVGVIIHIVLDSMSKKSFGQYPAQGQMYQNQMPYAQGIQPPVAQPIQYPPAQGGPPMANPIQPPNQGSSD